MSISLLFIPRCVEVTVPSFISVDMHKLWIHVVLIVPDADILAASDTTPREQSFHFECSYNGDQFFGFGVAHLAMPPKGCEVLRHSLRRIQFEIHFLLATS